MDKDKTIEQKKRLVITEDSKLNRIHEKGMFKNYRVKVNNLPAGTSATILENIDQLVKSKPDCLIVHAGTNDLANGINLLNQLKPRIVQYRDYTQISNDNFRKKLLKKLCLENINTNSIGLAKLPNLYEHT